MSRARSSRRILWALLVALAALWLPVPAVHAAVRIESFEALPSNTQAGGHPDIAFSFELSNRDTISGGGPCGCEDASEVTVHLPAGLIGNPHATPQCTVSQFNFTECPVDSQVGIIELALPSGAGGNDVAKLLSPVFNLVPPPGEAGLLGFQATGVGIPIFEVLSARTGGDYGLDSVTPPINQVTPLQYLRQVVWGVPADPTHDDLRFAFDEIPVTKALGTAGTPLTCDSNDQLSTGNPATVRQLCVSEPSEPGFHVPAVAEVFGFKAPSSNSPPNPFTQNPTTCGLTSLATSLQVLAYDGGTSEASSPWPATTGCDALAFNPSLFARSTTESTDSPSGFDVDLRAPSFESPETPSPSEIRGTVVTLPPGFTINPAAADGKSACGDAEARFGTTDEAQCPEFAKIGTLEVHSPVLPGTLHGAVYIGEPKPGERYRLVLAFDGFGVHVKLPGTVHPDPITGQIVTEFRNLPQFPFEDFNLHFFGAQRGILATPAQCGTYPVSTEFEPWDGSLPNQTSIQYFSISSGPNGASCPDGPRPFAPGFRAASTSNVAGAHTVFSLDVFREDGEQSLSGLTVATPPGFSATLRGVPYCRQPEIEAAEAATRTGLAELASSSCPDASLVGESFAGAGAGDHPYYAAGKVYLAGPYRGAPLSLIDVTPAVSGPYDLGDVVVRAALRVNPETAQVTAVSDPLPEILAGVPLRLRSILVELNRPGFALNPTDCRSFAVNANLSGSEGAIANVSSPFQVANCARLAFKPRLAIALKGPTKRSGHPALTATLKMPSGDANVARAQVALPRTELLDQGNLDKVCTQPEIASASCPYRSVYGWAEAWSPLLDRPLKGPVFLGVGYGHQLPDLVAELNGQIRVLLHGRVDTDKADGIRNTFEVVPDAPVSKFVLHLKGGKKYGLIENGDEGLCVGPQRAAARFVGQNGKVAVFHPKIKTACKKGRKKRHGRLEGKVAAQPNSSISSARLVWQTRLRRTQ